MTLDDESHRALLLEILTAKSLLVPASVVDRFMEVREAIRVAVVVPPDPAPEGAD